jgi:1-deoxy-D-xylulose-5-phosphate reductoisomerase
LFSLPPEKIEVLIHRTSVAHGFVLFTDGNIKAQLAPPDMRLPIGYALAYPDRLPEERETNLLALLGGQAYGSASLTFQRPDFERFPCLGLAYEALRRGGTVPAALSAANEIAVAAFAAGEIAFGRIGEIVEQVLRESRDEVLSLASLRAADARAREQAGRIVKNSLHCPEPALAVANGVGLLRNLR